MAIFHQLTSPESTSETRLRERRCEFRTGAAFCGDVAVLRLEKIPGAAKISADRATVSMIPVGQQPNAISVESVHDEVARGGGFAQQARQGCE